MQFADRPCPCARYIKTTEVDRLKSNSYSKAEVDLSFEYSRGEEERKISLTLTREEAQELVGELNEFINDRWSEFEPPRPGRETAAAVIKGDL